MTDAAQPADTPSSPETMATQAELYDDLRRIGELEDQKQQIQTEIAERTERLRNAIGHLEPTSLLHQMLTSALAPKRAPKRTRPAAAAKPRRKSAPKKKVRKRRK